MKTLLISYEYENTPRGKLEIIIRRLKYIKYLQTQPLIFVPQTKNIGAINTLQSVRGYFSTFINPPPVSYP